MADNNQQVPNAQQPAGSPAFSDPVAPPHNEVTTSIVNLGVNPAKTMTGNSVQSPLSGANVSMTTPQAYGGPIVSTEQGKVSNQTGPNA
jgi:hypothetical protein